MRKIYGSKQEAWRAYYARHTDEQKQRVKDRYYANKKLGICVKCGNREAEPNCVYCIECAEKNRLKGVDWYKRKKACDTNHSENT